MPKNQLRIATAIALIVGLMSATTVMATPVGSGGPWSFTRGPITIQYSGLHTAINNQAYAETFDYNGNSSDLGVRLKYSWNGYTYDSGWSYSPGSTPPSWNIRVVSPYPTTALSSAHRAENPWDLSWSGPSYPHAW